MGTPMIEALAEKAAGYKIGGDHLVTKIHAVKDALVKMLPSRFDFTAEGVSFSTNLKDSNVGSFGPAICYNPGGIASGNLRMSPVPKTWNEAGEEWYLHGDFNCKIFDATRYEIKEVGKSLPAFLKALAEYLDRGTEEMQVAGEVLDRMIAAIGGK